MEHHADHRAVGARPRGGQGGGSRPRRRRLPHQAVRRGRAARPDPGGAPARGAPGGRRARADLPGRRAQGGPGRAARVAGGGRGAPDAHRVQAAGRAGAERRQGLDPPAPAQGGVGHQLREPVALRAGVSGAAPAEARGRSGAAEAAGDGAGGGVSTEGRVTVGGGMERRASSRSKRRMTAGASHHQPLSSSVLPGSLHRRLLGAVRGPGARIALPFLRALASVVLLQAPPARTAATVSPTAGPAPGHRPLSRLCVPR